MLDHKMVIASDRVDVCHRVQRSGSPADLADGLRGGERGAGGGLRFVEPAELGVRMCTTMVSPSTTRVTVVRSMSVLFSSG
jgi:hypothetical protein